VDAPHARIGRDIVSGSAPPQVAILLCTYQGQAFLADQLQSIAAQSYDAWRVWASDDGSTDGTRGVLDRFRTAWGPDRLTIVDGPRRGFAANFRSLIGRPEIVASAYAYADQDDVWIRDKLERAVSWLGTVPASVPALYCSRTELIDDQGRSIGLSPRFRRPPSFANALVQNVAGGNTMVFNDAARQHLVAALVAGERAATYDWWTYLLVSGCGGPVFYDPAPTVRYRQHARNQVGANASWQDRAENARFMWRGRLRGWIDGNVSALAEVRELLTTDAQVRLARFQSARRRALIPRLAGVARAGVYRQTLIGNLGLVLAAVIDRL
jgi:glycosyltransferase involved in cell wall biosynthesis